MRLVPGLVMLLAILGGIAVFKGVTQHSLEAPIPKNVVAQYAQWKNTFQKLYATPAEDAHRLRVFYAKTLFIQQANAEYEAALWKRDGVKLESPMFAVNQFSDLTEEEFTSKYTGLQLTEEPLVEYDREIESSEPLETSIVLEQSGYDIRVRNQKSCGSCWAFAAMATWEKQYYDVKKQRLDLSHQEIVDCVAAGCNGGPPAGAIAYMIENSVSLASTYPYIAARQVCKSLAKVPKISGKMNNPVFTATLAIKLINAGKHPSVNVKAGGKFGSLSNNGVPFDASLSGSCDQSVTHSVALVGQSKGYLNVLNSWGTSWGDQGMKLIKPCSETNMLGPDTNIIWAD